MRHAVIQMVGNVTKGVVQDDSGSRPIPTEVWCADLAFALAWLDTQEGGTMVVVLDE